LVVCFLGGLMKKRWIEIAIACMAGPLLLSISAKSASKDTQHKKLTSVPKLPIGMNLPALTYYSPGLIFNDVMTTASDPFTSNAADPWNSGMIDEILKDENGYPLALPQRTSDGRSTFVRFTVNNLYAPGKYRIFLDGTGTLGGSAYQEGGKYYINLDGTGVNRWIDILTSSASDHIRRIRIYPASVTDPSSVPVFYAAYLEGLRPFHALRFMDFVNTNGSKQVEWSARVTKTSLTQGGKYGTAWDYAIDLCNELDADGWVCVPHMASDSYIRQMATLWHDRLESGRKVYLEFSNEMWNWNFPQSEWILNNAPGAADAYVSSDLAAIGPAGDMHPEKDAYMMARAFRIWGEVFAGQEGRVVNVATGQAGWWDNSRRILEYLKNRVHSPVEALAVAGYFGPTKKDHDGWIANPATATAGLMCDALYNGMEGASNKYARNSAAYAKQYGVDYLVYEGGQHLQPYNQEEWPYNQELYAAQIHPKMYQLYLENFTVHVAQDVNCKLFMAYDYVGARKSRWGSWGHLESLKDVNGAYSTIAPKYQALLDCNTQKR
jgi:hypothetical protein